MALSNDDDAGLLLARLVRQGFGLAPMQVDGQHVDIVARGETRAGKALREDALFEVGSITKTFTALLLADAVLRKVLTLDGAVEEALPGVKLRDAAGEPIRWVDLATQRSGLPRLPDNMAPKDEADPYADYDEERLLSFLHGFEASVQRATRWEYPNLGFGLLGHALAQAQRTSYAELLDRRVLQPLGMKRTALAMPGQIIAGLADGHDAARNVVPHWHFGVLMDAGALVMPASDLGRYAQPSAASSRRCRKRSHSVCAGTPPGRTSATQWAWRGCERR